MRTADSVKGIDNAIQALRWVLGCELNARTRQHVDDAMLLKARGSVA